jgi:23S rRNA pseudouridine1911/1915/1917 synthase
VFLAPPYTIPTLYEDSALLFVDKPPGLVVQRNYDPDEPVLIEVVTAALAARGETAFLMQRLDRGTSGVMFFSKLASVNSQLTRHFEKKLIRKRYLALVHGVVDAARTIDAPLARVGPISFAVREEGKRAVTEVEPLQWSDRATLVALNLLTGRTHQIRVHMAHIGHPLVGDWLYGERDAVRPMLHAASLEMIHPLTNESLRVEAPLPADFVEEAGRRGMEQVIGHR